MESCIIERKDLVAFHNKISSTTESNALSQKELLQWLKETYIEPENESARKRKPITLDFTLSMVYTIYRAIIDKQRPGYDSFYRFQEDRRNGETLLGIVTKIFSECPGYYAPHPKKQDPLNFLNKQILTSMVSDIRKVVQELAVFKLDYLLEEFQQRKEPLPEKLDCGDESDVDEKLLTSKSAP